MPLLFLDHLPPNFQQNSQLAAIATFMADSDDEEVIYDRSEAPEGVDNGKRRRKRRQQATRAKRMQLPYTKSSTRANKPRHRENRDDTGAADTKELQLFFTMFHVS
ncbi:hypothetical protein PHMEG_00026765 [Phytophthora megakarya]|uniref:Uncharacterized protein n=1 Tax=Phytophthora megakarya TaxID=4795 RepID=A0A225V8T7_9STRA|nr:hypothetical protein PHMEG_00026765 [Phytophthora megakarya]